VEFLTDLLGQGAVSAKAVKAAAQDAGVAWRIAERHDVVRVPVDGLLDPLRASNFGLSTMGRAVDEDAADFLAAAAAGRHAAGLIAA